MCDGGAVTLISTVAASVAAGAAALAIFKDGKQRRRELTHDFVMDLRERFFSESDVGHQKVNRRELFSRGDQLLTGIQLGVYDFDLVVRLFSEYLIVRYKWINQALGEIRQEFKDDQLVGHRCQELVEILEETRKMNRLERWVWLLKFRRRPGRGDLRTADGDDASRKGGVRKER